MNVLWITNNALPQLANAYNFQTSASGSWLIDISEKLANTEGINLAVACVHGKKFEKTVINNITYYLLPGNGRNMMFYTKKYEKLWKEIAEDFKVDIVHLHGTEYSHGLSFLRSNPSVKSLVSIQGIIRRIGEVYFDGLPKGFSLKYFTLKEFLKLNSVFMKAQLYKFNSKYEKEIINRANFAHTINFWDTSLTKQLNPNIECFNVEYNLRDSFYNSEKWDINKINRHQIFTTPGGDPIKGLHVLCKAVAIIKPLFHDVKVIVPGANLIADSGNGYGRYIKKLLKKLDIEENICFVGRLSEQEMNENMLRAHVCVIPSAIEGTSLVLRESMYLGVPTIASFRGGMADFINDKQNGYLYDFEEYSYLAHRIIDLFNNDQKANEISNNAIVKAQKAHDRQANTQNYIDMYTKIFNEE